MKRIHFHWYACHCSGSESCLENEFEEQKDFLKKVFGAYRFEII